MSFWEVLWFIIVAYAFIAYLMLLFSIIGDLIRDKEMSGGLKAVWFIALVVFPFLTALVYLITRGDGMTERSARQVDEMRQRQDAYIRETAGAATPSDQITQAKALLDSGTITQDEYARLKAKALG